MPDGDIACAGRTAVVAGGGLAGLAAAYRLGRLGWRVTVLEKEAEPGGRCRTVSSGGYLFDTGAQYCRDSFDSCLKTAIELGIGERFRMPGAPQGVYRDGRVLEFVSRKARSVAGLPNASAGSGHHVALIRALAACRPLLAHYRSYNVRFPAWWERGDGVTAAEFLDGRVSPDCRDSLAEPLALSALGAELDRTSAAGLMAAIRLTLADRTVSFTTGMGSLAEALAGRVEVKTGLEVTGILVEDGKAFGAAARTASGSEVKEHHADLVVCALPSPIVLDACPQLQGAAREAAAGTEYSTGVVVNLAYPGGAAGTPGPVLLPRREGFKASWVSTNMGKAYEQAPEGASVVTVVFTGREAESLMAVDDGAAADLAASEARRVYRLEGAAPVARRIDRHEFGRPVVSMGHTARVRALEREGSGIANLVLAGDWTSSPTVEGAMMSGFHAADTGGSQV